MQSAGESGVNSGGTCCDSQSRGPVTCGIHDGSVRTADERGRGRFGETSPPADTDGRFGETSPPADTEGRFGETSLPGQTFLPLFAQAMRASRWSKTF